MNTLQIHDQMTREEVEAYLDEVRDRVMTADEHIRFILTWNEAVPMRKSGFNSFIISLDDAEGNSEKWCLEFNKSNDSQLILHYITRDDIFIDRTVYQIRITDCVCARDGDDGDTPDIALRGCDMCCAFPFEIDDYKKVIESEAIARYAMRWMGSVGSYEDWSEKGEL